MDKFLFIINPISGNGRGKKLAPVIQTFLENNKINSDLKFTQSPKHATEIVKQEIGNYDVLVSVGGDGTLNEIVNGISDNYYDKISLGVLPIGTGNDFVKNISLSNEIDENLKIITGISQNIQNKIDLGIIEFQNGNNDNYQKHTFINGAGIGFDAYVGALTQNNKYLPGIFAYLFSVVKALFNFKMISGIFNINGNVISGSKLMISIGNGISHGGGFYLTPDAKINDGELNISIFDKISRTRLLIALPKALINKIKTVPEASFYKTNSIDIKLQLPYYLHCDGEIVSNSLTTAKIRILSKVLTIIEKMN